MLWCSVVGSRSVPAAGAPAADLPLGHRTSWLSRCAALLLIVIAVARVASTYREFNQIADEPSNLACGMQLLQDRLYSLDGKHPPLARLAIAIPLYCAGYRLAGPFRDAGTEPGNQVLYADNRYERNLTLARIGILPFFILACLAVWCWSRHIWGERAALFSLLVFTLLPTVLGHAGVATNDVAAAGSVALALYCLTLWLENPTWQATIQLGLGVGVAVASKFSALLFLPACAAAIVALRAILGHGMPGRQPFLKLAGKAAVSLMIVYSVLWAAYLFTVAPLQSPPHADVDRLLAGHPVVRHAVSVILEAPYPAGKAAGGITALAGHNRAGQGAFFFGEWRRHGWWYFFPVMFVFKTPLPFLLLSCIATVFIGCLFRHTLDWRIAAPLVFVAVLFLASMSSGINVGSRHVLAVYPLLAIAAGGVMAQLWEMARWRTLFRLIVAGACVWLMAVSALAHPDYIAYFNLFASDRPDRIEVDSDLDWGQDLWRLSKWLRERGVTDVAISYFGTADLTRSGLPAFHELQPYQEASGWVAISARNRVIPSPFLADSKLPGAATFYSIPGDVTSIRPGNGPFAWLMAYKPVATIGKSIFVYDIPPH